MRLVIVIAASIASLVAAQNPASFLGELPDCAYEPLIKGIAKYTGCGPTDFDCACAGNEREKLVKGLTNTLLAACGPQLALKVVRVTDKICNAAYKQEGLSTRIVPAGVVTSTSSNAAAATGYYGSAAFGLGSYIGGAVLLAGAAVA